MYDQFDCWANIDFKDTDEYLGEVIYDTSQDNRTCKTFRNSMTSHK